MMDTALGIAADIFLGIGAIGAAIYCFILSRKLSRLTGLDQELGSAIALLSQQVDEMSSALVSAQTSTAETRSELEETIDRANFLAGQLSNLCASAPVGHHQAEQNANDCTTDNETDLGGLKDGSTSLFLRHNRRAVT